jgi:hypothetical protein
MRFRLALGTALVVVLSAVAATGIATAAPGNSYTCSGGNFTGDPNTSTFTSIPTGDYASITVTGVCNVVPGAVINVTGNINVAAGALFDAQSRASTITVGHNVTAGAGSLLGLGCQSNTAHAPHPCTIDGVPVDENSVITVNGNVSATDAFLVLLNGITVNGNVTLTGGGGGGNGGNDWAEKNNTIGGNLTISDVTPDWLGVLFSNVGGNVNLSNITAQDPDDVGFGAAVSVFTNTVGKNLNCSNLGPRLTGGQSNSVGHKATGQCVGMVASA